MALHVVETGVCELVGPDARDILRVGLARDGHATLWAPSLAQALAAQRALAEAPGLGLGISCETPLSWTAERWELWGDGTHLVDGASRIVLATQVLASAEGVVPSSGVVGTFCDLVRRGLPWLAEEGAFVGSRPLPEDEAGPGMTSAERTLVAQATPYARELAARGLVEESQAMCAVAGRLREADVAPGTLVLVGFDALPPAARALVGELAAAGEVYLVVPAGTHPGHAQARRLAEQLTPGARKAGAGVTTEAGTGVTLIGSGEGERPDGVAELAGTGAAELAGLRAALFSADVERLVPTGAVRMVLPAGPAAEMPALCDEVGRLADEGARELVICAPDVRRAWKGLAPRLGDAGFAVDAQMATRFAATEAGRAFLEFARGVAHMAELAATWPVATPVDKDLLVVNGNMSWWPPRDLSDFLMSELSGVPAAQARRIDVRWRANRLLSPQAVLDTLLSEKVTSHACAQATRELLRGRLGSAASRLLAPLGAPSGSGAAGMGAAGSGGAPGVAGMGAAGSDGAPGGAPGADPAAPARQLARLEATEVLAAVLATMRSLSDLGISADPQTGTHDLSSLVDVATLALERTSVMLRPRLGGTTPGHDAPHVRILDPGAASQLAAGSADALVACGLTSHESRIPRDPRLAQELLDALGIEEAADPMDVERARFLRICAVPRSRLTLERTLFTAEGKDAYASAMLIEALACYGIEGGGKPGSFREAVRAGMGEGLVAERTETWVSRNVSPTGAPARPQQTETPAPGGTIDAALAPFVSPPPEGANVGADDPPLLSASQIETYLECPYKWFSLRRLRLADADAGFGGAEMGTFAHRVLEVTHQQMLAQAAEAHAEELLAAAGERGVEVPLLPPEASLAGTAAAAGELGTAGALGAPAAGAPGPAARPDLVALSQLMCDLRLPGSRVDLRDPATLERARTLLHDEFAEHLSHQYLLLRGRRTQPQALVPHDTQERGLLEALHDDLMTALDFEGRLFHGFEPRLFEWSFGRQDAVDYAGARLVGTIDRVDVDAHGQAVVIDYKHKAPRGFAAEYDVFAGEGRGPGMPFALPRRVQSLIYAQVVRRRHPELAVCGAVYLGTKGDHALAGAVAENMVDNVFGDVVISDARRAAVAVEACDDFGRTDGAAGMEALLDATEEAIAARVRELLAGNIEADPLDEAACAWCPVLNCERRLGA